MAWSMGIQALLASQAKKAELSPLFGATLGILARPSIRGIRPMSSRQKPNTRKVVVAAMAGNGLIAMAKLVAAGLSGSLAMIAEAAHSLVDTANQALLLVGMSLSKKTDPTRYPLGRAKETYFWAFIVALLLFCMGGVYGIYEGIHGLRYPGEAPGSPTVALAVILVSLVFEATSFTVAFREFKKERGTRSLDEALFQGRDPTIPVVLLEDTAAVIGLSIALTAVLVSWTTASTVPDAVGSILIGTLLCAVGVMLARDTRSLIIGEGVTPEIGQRALDLARGAPGVEAITQMLTYHLGPDTVLMALKVRFHPHTPVEEIERITDDLEARVRAELPMMKRIFVEADGDFTEST
jgi:cation diffusion facilitator family transporter